MKPKSQPRIVCSVCEKAIGVYEIPLCRECRETLALSDDANREMGLPEGVDWGNR